MKKVLLLSFSLLSIVCFSQNVEKKELTKKELEYLAKDIVIFLVPPTTEDYEKSVKNNLVTYGFEIIYNDNVIYRGVINKPSIANTNQVMTRRYAAFCLKYDTFDAETKLELAENEKIKLKKNKLGKKYFCFENFELFKMDKYKGLILNDKISEKVKLKFFKITYNN